MIIIYISYLSLIQHILDANSLASGRVTINK